MPLLFTPRSHEDRRLTRLAALGNQASKTAIRAGFTLAETLLVIVILGLALAAMAPLMRATYNLWNIGDRKTEMLQNGRAGMETVVRHIRAAKRITGIPADNSGRFIRFRDTYDSQLVIFHNVAGSVYYVAPTATSVIKDNDLVLRTSGADNPTVTTYTLLAKSLNSFRIEFRNSAGGVATRPGDVNSIEISMRLYDPQGIISDTVSLFSGVAIRNELKLKGRIWAVGYSGSNCLMEVPTDTYSSGSYYPISVSVNPNNGECWVAEYNLNRVRRISSAGAILADVGGFNRPYCVSVNSNTGECWVADIYNNRVVKLSPSGAVLLSIGGLYWPFSVSVNSATGECWVADTYNYHIKKFSATGQLLLDLSTFTYNPNPGQQVTSAICSTSVSVNPNTGDCWVAFWPSGVIRFSASGQVLSYALGFRNLRWVSVNSATNECWVADTENNRIKKVSPTGVVLSDLSGFNNPWCVSVNSATGECWVADRYNNRVVELDSSGSTLFTMGFSQAIGISASP